MLAALFRRWRCSVLLNDGTASAADIEQLIAHVMQTVQRTHGVPLKPEVRIVGEAKRG